ncbi:rhodanese-like domain-containing protein [Actinomadura keratinilytica]
MSGEDFLLDVREDDEWNAGHAADALHIPMSAFVERYGELTEAAPQDGRVNVVCRSGARSAQVTMYLRQQGIDAVNVEGGMRAWEIAAVRWSTRRASRASSPEADTGVLRGPAARPVP